MVDYEPLPAVTRWRRRRNPDAPRLWDENPDNISHTFERGDRAATEAAFARAAHIVKRRYVITRVHAQYMEPRGSIGVVRPVRGPLHAVCRRELSAPRAQHARQHGVQGAGEPGARRRADDVGGGFGAKGWQYVDHRLVLWAARKLDRPVKWNCERSEVLLADEHGRDNVGEIELAFDATAKIIGLRLHMLASIGAYIASDRQLLTPFGRSARVVGVYDIPGGLCHDRRGAVEHQPDRAVSRRRPARGDLSDRTRHRRRRPRSCGIDPIELRRRNVIQPKRRCRTRRALGPFYDCGEFARNMEMALEASDYAGFAARREASRARGKLRGIGLANAIEQAAGPVPEYAEVRFNPSGSAMLLMGTKTHGQGHETVFKQILYEKLGIDPKEVQFIDGDTDRVAFGMGSNGSRSMVTGGSALTLAAEKMIDKGKKLAAHLLEAAEADIEFADAQVHRRRHRPQRDAEAGGDGRVPAGAAAAGHGAGPDRAAPPMRRSATPIPTAAMSARSRSIRRPARSICSATSWSTMSAR